jgi:hypothetical protein
MPVAEILAEIVEDLALIAANEFVERATISVLCITDEQIAIGSTFAGRAAASRGR